MQRLILLLLLSSSVKAYTPILPKQRNYRNEKDFLLKLGIVNAIDLTSKAKTRNPVVNTTKFINKSVKKEASSSTVSKNTKYGVKVQPATLSSRVYIEYDDLSLKYYLTIDGSYPILSYESVYLTHKNNVYFVGIKLGN